MKPVALILVWFLVVTVTLTSEDSKALTQPDISVIGDFRAFTGDYKDIDGHETDRNGTLNYQLNSLELAFNGNLNPYTRGDFYIANHGHEFEIEEAYVTFLRGLPLHSQIRVGKYLVDFGRLNVVHPHAYSFLDRPLIHRTLFGFDGFTDIGVNINFLLPTDFYSKLSLNILAGDLFEEHAHAHEEETMAEEEHEAGRNSEEPIFTGRLNFFLPVGEKGNLDFGFSGLYGLYQKHIEETENHEEKLYAAIGAFDLKYKHKWSDYTALVLQGELFVNNRDMLVENPVTLEEEKTDISNLGFWSAVDLRFSKRYNIGFKYDYTPGIFDHQEENDYGYAVEEELNNTPLAKFDDENATSAFTLFGGFMLMEETTLIRLAATYMKFTVDNQSMLANTMRVENDSEYTITVQVVWSLGPHKPHDF